MQVGDFRDLGQSPCRAVARQKVRQTVGVAQVQVFVDGGVAHVSVDQHRFEAQLRKIDGQCHCRGGFALVLGRAGHHQAPWRPFRGGELQRRAHRSVGLGKMAARVVLRLQGHARGLVALLLDFGNHTQQRNHENLFHLVGKLDRVVHRLHQKHQPQAQHQPCQQANGRVQCNLGLVGEQRHLGLVHHLDIVAFHPASHAHLLDLLQQAVVKLAVGVHLALEQVVINALVLPLHNLAACFIQARAQQGLLPFGHLKIVAHRCQYAAHLGLDLAVQIIDLGAQLLHLGKVVFVDLGALLVFGIQLAALGLVVLNRLAIQHLAGRVGRLAHRLVFRLGLEPLLLHLGQRRREIGKRLVHHVGFLIQRQNVAVACKLVELALRLFESRLGQAQLGFQKRFGIRRRLQPPLKVERNKGLCDRIGNACRQLWVGVFCIHLDHARIAHQFHGYRLVECGNHLFTVKALSAVGGRLAHLVPALLDFAQHVAGRRHPAGIGGLPLGGVGLFLGSRCGGGGQVLRQALAVKPQLVNYPLGQNPAFEQL